MNRPIGIFDSGVGGLTVFREVASRLPHESIIYFGDTARVPYGSKSVETVKRYAKQDAMFLLSRQVKLLIAACNTVSSIALEDIREMTDVPVIGVIDPGVRSALQRTKTGRVGIIGTVATLSSGAYENSFKRMSKNVELFHQVCPLFVPLAEEGWADSEVAYLVANEYLHPLKEKKIDTLVLGCTHYPLLKKVISQVMGEDVVLIDSAEETAQEVRELLYKNNSESEGREGIYSFFVSDMPGKFDEIFTRFLGDVPGKVEKVDIFSF